jgi:hypothetical protein
MKTKVCTKCQEEFPATTEYFYSSPRNKYGVTAWCRECTLEQGRKRYHNQTPKQRQHSKKLSQKWEQENREKRNEQKRGYDRSEYLKEYYSKEENKQRRKEYCKQYYDDNKERYQLLNKKNFRKNKSRYYTRAAKHRAKQRDQTPDFANHELISRIYDACPKGYHMKPLAKGGLHHESNLCYLPASINRSKGSKTIEEFGQEEFNKHVIYWQVFLLEE